MNMQKYQQDHNKILAHISELRKLVHQGITENADEIANMIVAMSSIIKLHLAKEDRFLYPTLAKSKDPEIAMIGTEFQAEMGGVASTYTVFAHDWSIGKSIADQPEAFRASANMIFKALHIRIQRENVELYPAAERI